MRGGRSCAVVQWRGRSSSSPLLRLMVTNGYHRRKLPLSLRLPLLKIKVIPRDWFGIARCARRFAVFYFIYIGFDVFRRTKRAKKNKKNDTLLIVRCFLEHTTVPEYKIAWSA